MTKGRILRIQGAYYVATGLWPLLSMRCFERVTGPKIDKWLVQMVGLLAAAIGTALLVAANDDDGNGAAIVLSIGSAVSFASIDVIHSVRRRISRVYLGDAICEACILAALIDTFRQRRGSAPDS